MSDKRDLDVNNARVQGPDAHNAAVTGFPLLNAAIANDSDNTTPPNRVSAESNLVRLVADRDGSLHVLPYGVQIWDYHENSSSGLSAILVQSAPGSGLALYITSIAFSIGAAVDSNFWLTAGTTTTIFGPHYIEGKSGRGVYFPFVQPKKVTTNTDLRIHTGVTVLHAVDINGFIAQG